MRIAFLLCLVTVASAQQTPPPPIPGVPGVLQPLTRLVNDYGNLASRVLNMLRRYADARVPEVDVDPALAEDFAGLPEKVCELLDRAEITQALDRIWQRVRRLNRYVEETAPWQLAKDDANAAQLDLTLRSLAEGIRSVTAPLPCCVGLLPRWPRRSR